MVAARPKQIRLGDLLVKHEMITQNQLELALTSQKSTGHKLGQVLIDSGMITEDHLLNFLARQLNIKYIDLRRFEYQSDTVKRIPENLARRYLAMALVEEGNHFLVGMSDPTNIFAFDEIAKLLNKPIHLAVVREKDLLAALDKSYPKTQELSGLAAELELEIGAEDTPTSLNENLQGAPVVKLLYTLLEDAIQSNASDIHFEPIEKELRIRFRIDGQLRIQTTAERRVASALISRIKLMAGLDISEKRMPQDGRFNLKIQHHNIDVRVATLPTQYGESAVLRILNLSKGIQNLDRIGMPEPLLKILRHLIHNPYGLVLVTGPTGSGKTTTLYSALAERNDPSLKVITVEDPVEYRLAGVNQVQVNPKIDLSFTRILRAILRQDPDIILIGEIRDRETAEIALRAAMTGHLVLSTLHTNDALSTPVRLMDMGAEPYLIAGALKGILAQRLVRKICENCSENHDIHAVERHVLETEFGTELAQIQFKHGKGCRQCNATGYAGRVGIYELLEITTELATPIQEGNLTKFAQRAREQAHYQSLKTNAIQLAMDGITTVNEVLRVAFSTEI